MFDNDYLIDTISIIAIALSGIIFFIGYLKGRELGEVGHKARVMRFRKLATIPLVIMFAVINFVWLIQSEDNLDKLDEIKV